MGELQTAVIKNFGIKVNRVIKEKAYFICDTSEGLKKIARTSDSAEHILFQHHIKEHLFRTGYPWTDRYALSITGQPFTAIGGDYFIMTPFIKGWETNFENGEDVVKIMASVARFHLFARHIPLTGEWVPSPDLNEYFCRQLQEFNSIAKRVRRQPRLSDFDVLFVKNLHFYTEQIKNAIDSLAHTDYSNWRNRAVSQRHICHNALKEESLVHASNGHVYITHHHDASVDTQLNDVNALIRRYVQRSGPKSMPINRLLEAYNRVEPLSRSGIAVLYALLQFPWHFMKLVSQYYSKKRSWTPNAMANRMHVIVSEKEYFNSYISDLIHQI